METLQAFVPGLAQMTLCAWRRLARVLGERLALSRARAVARSNIDMHSMSESKCFQGRPSLNVAVLCPYALERVLVCLCWSARIVGVCIGVVRRGFSSKHATNSGRFLALSGVVLCGLQCEPVA